jgi:hypothetical protein
MAYASNGSLYDHLKQREPHPLPIKIALNILLQVGAALQYAHQQNVIHRDLKPANILFDANGDALLADFSVATMLDTSMKYGTAIGTPYYMAPEQFHGTISKEGDQYALGCIAYQMVTGRLPFDAPDFFALGYKHMTEHPVPPTQINLLVPPSIEAAILRAMAKQRTSRFPDVASFLAALAVQRPNITNDAHPQAVKRQEYRIPPPPATVWPEFVELSQPHTLLQSSPYSTQPPSDDAEEETLKLPRQKAQPEAPSINRRATKVMAFTAEPVKDSVNEAVPPLQYAPTMLSATNIRWDEPVIADIPLDVPEAELVAFSIQTQASTTQRGNTSRVLSIAAAIIVLLVLLGGTVFLAVFGMERAAATLFPPALTATINITPSHVNLDQTYTISAVTGTPVESRQQVSARDLSFSTPLQARTYPVTGQGTKPATEAQGNITFKSNVSRPINIGTNTKITIGDDLIAYPDASFILKPHSTVTKSAHISSPGPNGNIAAGRIKDTCCSGHVSVYNNSAFTGGANATTYAAVSQSDYNNAVAAVRQMQAAETTSAMASIADQVHVNEKIAGSIQCTPHASYNHRVGDQASSITGSVSVTCVAKVYDQQGVATMATNLLKAKATSTTNDSFLLTGTTTTTVKQAQLQSNGSILLLVEARSTATYQFDEAQQQSFAALVAGKSKQQALSILQKQPGIKAVTIGLSDSKANALPTTTKDITFIVTAEN